jgi:hypothetical protein
MASQSDEMRGEMRCVVDVYPGVVDAGAEITLQAKVSCAPACDLRGHVLLIKDDAGGNAGSIELTEFDGETNETGELIVKAPVRPGGYAWIAVCPAVAKEGISYAEASTPVSFTVKPHTANVVAWDIPSAIVVGERFRIKVGIKCSAECRLANRSFGIYDHEGARLATGTLSDTIWPGTSALYVSEVELHAPAAEGLYAWTVSGPSTEPGAERSDAAIPHDESVTSFGVRVVSRPEYVVKVETVDKLSQTPLSGARVVMHPYKAVTDERGVAEVRVAKGAYRLFVSQTRYVTYGLPLDVDADMTARAELYLEPETERN